jgi:hypothetical protein
MQACSEFFSMQSSNRRAQSKYNCCYSCLAKSRKCKGGCCRIQEVPAELICADCASNMKIGSPPCLLMCGLGHTRPSQEDLRKSLEAWIPGLNLRSLGNQLNVGLTWVGVETTATPLMAHVTRTSKPSPQPLSVVYDTATGQARPISRKDNIIRTSSEVAYYAMQTIRIKDQDVLVFFDSGSNGHLIEGELAEELQLEVVTDTMVPIGGLGGKTVWSDYGLYTVTLGPDTNGDLHELDIQGIRAITNKIPEVQLDALWSEAKMVVQDRRPMPVKIGGTRVNILVGIKSTRLGPKLVHVLPNGLGIYESVLRDIYHSNMCFGGPHEVFTKAYRDAGRIVNNVDILFTEMAQAYMNAPRTFVTAMANGDQPKSRIVGNLEQAEACVKPLPISAPTPDSLVKEPVLPTSLSQPDQPTQCTGCRLTSPGQSPSTEAPLHHRGRDIESAPNLAEFFWTWVMLWLGQVVMLIFSVFSERDLVENADFMAELSDWKFPTREANPETATFPVKVATSREAQGVKTAAALEPEQRMLTSSLQVDTSRLVVVEDAAKEADNPAVTNVEQLSFICHGQEKPGIFCLPDTSQKLQQQPLLAVLKMPGKPPPKQ